LTITLAVIELHSQLPTFSGLYTFAFVSVCGSWKIISQVSPYKKVWKHGLNK